MVDKEACVAICSYFEPDGRCEDVSVTNSIAAGCYFAGFTSPGHDCDEADSQVNFRYNTAHSVEGSGGLIFPHP